MLLFAHSLFECHAVFNVLLLYTVQHMPPKHKKQRLSEDTASYHCVTTSFGTVTIKQPLLPTAGEWLREVAPLYLKHSNAAQCWVDFQSAYNITERRSTDHIVYQPLLFLQKLQTDSAAAELNPVYLFTPQELVRRQRTERLAQSDERMLRQQKLTICAKQFRVPLCSAVKQSRANIRLSAVGLRSNAQFWSTRMALTTSCFPHRANTRKCDAMVSLFQCHET